MKLRSIIIQFVPFALLKSNLTIINYNLKETITDYIYEKFIAGTQVVLKLILHNFSYSIIDSYVMYLN